MTSPSSRKPRVGEVVPLRRTFDWSADFIPPEDMETFADRSRVAPGWYLVGALLACAAVAAGLTWAAVLLGDMLL